MIAWKKIKRLGQCVVALSLTFFTVACYDPKEVPGLIRKLHSPVVKERNDAALRLGYMGGKYAAPATPDLIMLLHDENVGVQSSAAYALRRIDNAAARQALEKNSAKR